MNGTTITALIVAALATALWRRAARRLRDEKVAHNNRVARINAAYTNCRTALGRSESAHAKTRRALDRVTSREVKP